MSSSPRSDPTEPASIAGATFATAFRGFDPAEVRSFLERVAAHLSSVEAERQRLAGELQARELAGLDEAKVTALLGEETTRILTSARDAGAQTRQRADEGAARILKDAQEEADGLRADAVADALRIRKEAEAAAEAEREAGRREGREMVAEARAVRERMLTDLARRRDAARLQIQQLQAARDDLLGSFREAQSSVDASLVATRAALERAVEQVQATEDELPPEPDVRLDATGETPVVRTDPATLNALASASALEVTRGPEEPSVPEAAPAGAAEVPAPEPEPEVAAAPEPEPAPSVAAEVDAHFDRLAAPPAIEITDPFAHRAVAVETASSSLSRHLKRALSDEQNEVLDGLRRRAVPSSVEELLGSQAEHAERYRAVAEEDLWTAAAAGAASSGAHDAALVHAALDRHGVLEAGLDGVSGSVVAPLRERLARGLEQAKGDAVEASSLLRAAYREWKTQHVDDLAAALAADAYGQGAFAAVPDGAKVRWVCDPTSGPCPDCRPDAAAGPLAAGQAFPSGHRHPPAHAGCRCLIQRDPG